MNKNNNRCKRGEGWGEGGGEDGRGREEAYLGNVKAVYN